ncbi:hypothetical protein OSG_eHP40_00240 [environmental Halophage eHP-40]|nr:hypothetical protein OSG_eHP40_00240 [environmental Halophage eHP-40]
MHCGIHTLRVRWSKHGQADLVILNQSNRGQSHLKQMQRDKSSDGFKKRETDENKGINQAI